MNAYFDSAVIAKLYVQESNSAEAIYHAAAALIIGTPEFVSLDDRQRELAKREGLKVKP